MSGLEPFCPGLRRFVRPAQRPGSDDTAQTAGVAASGMLYLNLAGQFPGPAALGAFRHASSHAEAVTFLSLAALAVVGVAVALTHATEHHTPRLAPAPSPCPLSPPVAQSQLQPHPQLQPWRRASLNSMNVALYLLFSVERHIH